MVLGVVVLFWWQRNQELAPRGNYAVRLYYYDSEKDRDVHGNILCSKQGLVPVEREISRDGGVIENTLQLLLLGHITEVERVSGVSTGYPLLGFALENTVLEDGILTLEFKDTQHKTVGGACRVGVLWAQIEATARQFSEVREVQFLPTDIFQP